MYEFQCASVWVVVRERQRGAVIRQLFHHYIKVVMYDYEDEDEDAKVDLREKEEIGSGVCKAGGTGRVEREAFREKSQSNVASFMHRWCDDASGPSMKMMKRRLL